VVHKFGGSSVADEACFERVARIVEQGPLPQAIVVSACRGVTDRLLGLVDLAESQDPSLHTRLVELRDRHARIADALLDVTRVRAYREQLDGEVEDIQGMLRTITLLRSGGRKPRAGSMRAA
jgi:aspartokinase